MVNATMKVEVDWSGDLDYGDTGEDITARAMRTEWHQGRDYASQLTGRSSGSRCLITLNNESGDYSSFNTSSPLTGLILPGRRVRIQATDATDTVTLWTGFLDRINPHPSINDVNVALLEAIGPLGRLAAITIHLVMQDGTGTTIKTGVIVDAILDAAEWYDYPTIVVADSPGGYWKMDESSGNLADSSANSNTGTATSLTYSQTALIGRADNTSIEFDGVASRAQVSNDSSIQNIFSGGGSCEGWLDADSDGEGNAGRIFDKGWALFVGGESAGAMELTFRHPFSTTNGTWKTDSLDISINTTHHVVVTYNRSDVANDPIIYIDGVAVGITESDTPVGTATTDAGVDLFLGNRSAADRTFDGHLDELALYSDILTAAEVLEHYIAGVSRDIDPGQTSLKRYIADSISALDALRDMEEAENGFLHESAIGAVVFENRHRRLTGAHLTSQATFSDAGGAARTYIDIAQSDPWDQIFNRFEVTIQQYTVGAEATIWVLSDNGSASPSLAPGESKTYIAHTLLEDNRWGINAWSDLVEGTDYIGNTQADGGGTNRSSSLSVTTVKEAERMTITVTNNHATDTVFITTLQAKGTPLTKDDPATIPVEDTASQAIYEVKTFPLPARWLPDTDEGLQYISYLLTKYASPSPIVAFTVQGNRDATHLSEVLRRFISDRITIVASNDTALGISEVFFIESVQHTIDSNLFHQATYECSSIELFSGLDWVLNTGALNATTGLNWGAN